MPFVIPGFSGFNQGKVNILPMEDGVTITAPGPGRRMVPSGWGAVMIEAWGGGGGGGDASAGGSLDEFGGGGGGGGAYCRKDLKLVTPGDIIAYEIGAGGVDSPDFDAAAEDGGDTIVDEMTAGGGQGAQLNMLWDLPSAGGAGGVASGGDVNTNGSAGANGGVDADGGAGGDSPNGGTGGATKTTAGVGNSGDAPGGGGGGAHRTTDGFSHGGHGANGGVRFTKLGAVPEYLYSSENLGSGSSKMVEDVPFGDERSDRLIVVAVHQAGPDSVAPTVSSVTIGGVAATQAATGTGAFQRVTLFYALVPTGESGDVEVAWSGSIDRSYIGVWSLKNYESAIPIDTDGAGGGSDASRSVTLDYQEDGVVIAACHASLTSNSAFTGVTEDYSVDNGVNDEGLGGSDMLSTTASGQTISATCRCICGAVWR